MPASCRHRRRPSISGFSGASSRASLIAALRGGHYPSGGGRRRRHQESLGGSRDGALVDDRRHSPAQMRCFVAVPAPRDDEQAMNPCWHAECSANSPWTLHSLFSIGTRGGRPLRGPSLRLSTAGTAATRLRHRRTVLTSQPTRRAIAALGSPSSASTAIRARTTSRCGTFPQRARRRSSSRTARGSVTGVAFASATAHEDGM